MIRHSVCAVWWQELSIRLNRDLQVKAIGSMILVNDIPITVNRSHPFVLAIFGGLYCKN